MKREKFVEGQLVHFENFIQLMRVEGTILFADKEVVVVGFGLNNCFKEYIMLNNEDKIISTSKEGFWEQCRARVEREIKKAQDQLDRVIFSLNKIEAFKERDV